MGPGVNFIARCPFVGPWLGKTFCFFLLYDLVDLNQVFVVGAVETVEKSGSNNTSTTRVSHYKGRGTTEDGGKTGERV
jgi:hypothetical protein